MAEDQVITVVDETAQEAAQEETAQEEAAVLQTADGVPGNVRALPRWAREQIRQLRQESATRRVELIAARESIARGEAAQAQHQAQLDAALSEIATLQPQAERMTVLDAYVRDAVAVRVAALPAAYRGLVPQYDDPIKMLMWLDANATLLTPLRAPALDAGVRGDSRAARISNAERDIARRFGLTPQQYADAKKG